ncbi:NAD(P)-binding protein [Clavulina sp. PMI_390]|nr:NAD(P)-binding protein [Clavulina sp. PMI_390]
MSSTYSPAYLYLYSIWRYWFGGQRIDLPETRIDLTDRVVIVTGSNGGLGKDVAKKIAALGAEKVIMAVRNVSKGEEAREDLLKSNVLLGPATLEVWQLDLSDFSSVKAFAQRANAELSRLDVLCLNAGVIKGSFTQTKDGWEEGVQVNALSTFYLSLLLLPLLQTTAKEHYSTPPPAGSLAKPHITIVSSGQHRIAPLVERKEPEIFKAMNTPESFLNPGDRYHDTKLLEVLFVQELVAWSEKTAPGAVIINSSSPGFCHSSLSQGMEDPARRRRMAVMKFFFARPGEIGARALTWAAVESSTTGGFSADCEDGLPSEWSRSDDGVATAGRVWKETLDILGAFDGGIRTTFAT